MGWILYVHLLFERLNWLNCTCQCRLYTLIVCREIFDNVSSCGQTIKTKLLCIGSWLIYVIIQKLINHSNMVSWTLNFFSGRVFQILSSIVIHHIWDNEWTKVYVRQWMNKCITQKDGQLTRDIDTRVSKCFKISWSNFFRTVCLFWTSAYLG